LQIRLSKKLALAKQKKRQNGKTEAGKSICIKHSKVAKKKGKGNRNTHKECKLGLKP